MIRDSTRAAVHEPKASRLTPLVGHLCGFGRPDRFLGRVRGGGRQSTQLGDSSSSPSPDFTPGSLFGGGAGGKREGVFIPSTGSLFIPGWDPQAGRPFSDSMPREERLSISISVRGMGGGRLEGGPIWDREWSTRRPCFPPPLILPVYICVCVVSQRWRVWARTSVAGSRAEGTTRGPRSR